MLSHVFLSQLLRPFFMIFSNVSCVRWKLHAFFFVEHVDTHALFLSLSHLTHENLLSWLQAPLTRFASTLGGNGFLLIACYKKLCWHWQEYSLFFRWGGRNAGKAGRGKQILESSVASSPGADRQLLTQRGVFRLCFSYVHSSGITSKYMFSRRGSQISSMHQLGRTDVL